VEDREGVHGRQVVEREGVDEITNRRAD